jgi:hypothetical protein
MNKVRIDELKKLESDQQKKDFARIDEILKKGSYSSK